MNIEKLTKERKHLVSERDKNKARIQKLIQRKGKFDSGLKTCKNCHQEYQEKENFNWSCKLHQSDWGGEMWWCCGKTSKEAIGCKYQKHESKDDAEDSADDDGEKKEKVDRNLRCFCCREIGHTL